MSRAQPNSRRKVSITRPFLSKKSNYEEIMRQTKQPIFAAKSHQYIVDSSVVAPQQFILVRDTLFVPTS